MAVPTVPPLLTIQVGEPPRVMFEEMVSVIAEVFAEFVTVICEDVPMVMLPPERVMFEEEAIKLMTFALTLPETVIVPAPIWLVEVPKLILSDVVVVFEPDIDEVPALLRVQPWVALFVVGAAHVPWALPKPAAESLESHQ